MTRGNGSSGDAFPFVEGGVKRPAISIDLIAETVECQVCSVALTHGLKFRQFVNSELHEEDQKTSGSFSNSNTGPFSALLSFRAAIMVTPDVEQL